MDEVGIRVIAAKILQWSCVAHRASCKTKAAFKYLPGIGAGHCMHGIEGHRHPLFHGLADRGKGKQLLHQVSVIGHRVDHLYRHLPHRDTADGIKVNVGRVDIEPAVNLQRTRMDCTGNAFRSRAAIGDIVLDAEILVRPAGIVAGREDQPTAGAVFADHMAGCRG